MHRNVRARLRPASLSTTGRSTHTPLTPDSESRTQIYYNAEERIQPEVFVHEKNPGDSIRHVEMKTTHTNQVSFVVLADSGVPGYHRNAKIDGFHGVLGDKLLTLRDGIDFVVMAGDNFYDKGVADCNDEQWKDVWFKRLNVDQLNVPFFTVLGNHDILGDRIVQSNYHKCPGKAHMSKYWMTPGEDYTLSVNGNLKMFFINTNTRDPESVQTIENALKRYEPNFVIGHHPMSVQGIYNKHGSYLAREKSSAKDFELKGESLMAATLHRIEFPTYLCGHLHAMQYGETGIYEDERKRFESQTKSAETTMFETQHVDPKTQILVGGGGGNLYNRLEFGPSSHQRQHTSSSSSFNERVHGFAVVTVNIISHAQTVIYYTYADDGSEVWKEQEFKSHFKIKADHTVNT
uniref:Uncharacterized protein AlNc14C40G3467 n=1 Tax=Albugo laibachii Nc14 TaxID=890382 RepID=F0W9L2_9STRA|nr:unknown putative [Albugo laibachii Nc14]|eukprot:CCA17830.1 unknown putative [Albugo laibachii Nc14]